ncbi:MAG: division/cell wall cluster transcriptional repressor MraZ [Candidatus Omnitrophica bacterium]|nr:division/cell wall cluster transcriptional repressor MraZ [Candidatus Omnitrophota bacterium]MBI2495429.1 division/cell wall cluster transcriptional repressor MraZ [Candidatus Omnitrophota bacterium]MBI3021489.1 division/cell wall cluster transcriptional repressor MraZ [Candidatus Omnitrophota bacterium]MBI3084090.1 division/cell wall cluster transcriptional repressor MraZ [Candidatus Omnitrophota bacterium]
MLYGEYEHTIDRKGRLIVPAKFRQAFKTHDVTSLFLTRGLDGCLFLFPEAEWRLAENRFKQIPFTKGEGRKFNRLFFSGAVEVTVDRLGRLLVPRSLKEFAQIKEQVVIVGVSSRMEIWSKEKWQDFYESSRQSFEEIAERVMVD